ncbi:MAG: hypothetical protein ACREP6_01185 [Candidatus Binataceae bacterium]
MKFRRGSVDAAARAGAIAIVIIVAMLLARSSIAWARPARPWLCRDKPVFSSHSVMRYRAVFRGARNWRLMFMTFQIGAPNDGFTIVESHDLGRARTKIGGQLAAGQYFAVAQYARGGEWICPDTVHDNDRPSPGDISNICYGGPSSNCAVRLSVRPAASPATH